MAPVDLRSDVAAQPIDFFRSLQEPAQLKGLFVLLHKASSIWVLSLELLPSPAPLPGDLALPAFPFPLLLFGFPSWTFFQAGARSTGWRTGCARPWSPTRGQAGLSLATAVLHSATCWAVENHQPACRSVQDLAQLGPESSYPVFKLGWRGSRPLTGLWRQVV